MSFGEGFKSGGEVGEGLDAVQLRRLDEGSDTTPVASALVMARKKRGFSVQSQRPDQILDGIVVDLDAAVVEEDLKAVPVIGEVAELLAHAGFRRDLRAHLGEPGA